MKFCKCLLPVFLLVTVIQVYAETPEAPQTSNLLSALREVKELRFCDEKVPLENREVHERLEKELLLTLWDRPQVLLWLKRSTRYLPEIDRMLAENQMPADLRYVAIAESALRPHVGSPKRAVGFWQFMTGTGRKYGLSVDERIDERRSLSASTRAAIRYFNDLHDTFGNWTLAVAAFNMGEEGLMAEILSQEVNDYYRLYLPLETQRFIFRILAVKLILEDPEGHGFHLTEQDYYAPLQCDQVQVDCFQDIPIRIVAQAAHTYFKMIKDLNPEIRGHYLSAGSHSLLLPQGAAAGFQERFHALVKAYIEDQSQRVYVVQKGDNLSSIAAKFDVPLAALLIWNRLELNQPIHPGQRLLIYPRDLTPQ